MIRPREPEDWPPGTSERAAQERDAVEEILRLALDSGDFHSLEELNAALAEYVDAYNRRPQRELLGLSPEQVRRLLADPWDGTGPLRLDESLPLDVLQDSPLLVNAREFLAFLAEGEGVRATAAGNLTRAAVAALLERLSGLEGAAEAVRRYSKVINEGDISAIFRLRILLRLAGLLRLAKGRFRITRRGRTLLAPERAGELFALLFRTHFRRFNLAALDGCAVAPGFQYTVPVMLERFQRLRPHWWSAAELAPHLVLPPVRDEAPIHVFGTGADAYELDDLPIMIERRLLEPLLGFGLLRMRELPRAERGLPRHVYRKASLFDRFVRWELPD